MTLNNKVLTPKITNEAPVSVAECPPLGTGGTPSIYGKAHNHFLSTVYRLIMLHSYPLDSTLEIGFHLDSLLNFEIGSSISEGSL